MCLRLQPHSLHSAPATVVPGQLPLAKIPLNPPPVSIRAIDDSGFRGQIRRVSVPLIGSVTVALLLSFVMTGSAQAETVQVLALAESVTEVINNIRNWLMGILAGLATVFLSIGGVRYVMAGGDPGEVEKSKQAFKSAGWGYGLAALAPLVVEILKGIVGT